MDEEQEIVKKLYQTGQTESSSKESLKLIDEPKKKILHKTAMPLRSTSSVSDIYRRAKAKLPKLQSRARINKDESINILIKMEENPKEPSGDKFEKKKMIKRDDFPTLPLEIYFNQDFQDSSLISIANRPLPPLPK